MISPPQASEKMVFSIFQLDKTHVIGRKICKLALNQWKFYRHPFTFQTPLLQAQLDRSLMRISLVFHLVKTIEFIQITMNKTLDGL